jgi:hypothetical protein
VGVLLLFGGGLSLAAAIATTGVDDFLGLQVRRARRAPGRADRGGDRRGGVPHRDDEQHRHRCRLIPIVAPWRPGLGLHPLALAIPVAIAASLAFMLPVATPPNAIVFGSGFVGMPDADAVGAAPQPRQHRGHHGLVPLLALPVLGIDLPLGVNASVRPWPAEWPSAADAVGRSGRVPGGVVRPVPAAERLGARMG